MLPRGGATYYLRKKCFAKLKKISDAQRDHEGVESGELIKTLCYACSVGTSVVGI